MINNKRNYLNSPIGPQISINHKQFLYFGGTAYLGIPQNEEFLKLYTKGLKLFGLNNGTSRGNNLQLEIYDETENCAANRFGSEAALITSSGFLVAQLAVKQLSGYGEVRYAPNTHPALWLNDVPKVDLSFSNWVINIIKEINTSSKQNWVLITNSMNNLYPERYDFSFIKKLNKQVIIIVDDSHGIGINNNGLGVLSDIPICKNIEIVVVASMAKALGIDAGIILSNKKHIEQLKKSTEFLGASPPAAAGLYAFMQGEEIYINELNQLNNSMKLMSSNLDGNTNWDFVKDFPVYLAKNAELSNQLHQKGIMMSSFPYPDKNGPVISRIVISSWHSKSNIETLIKALN